MDKVAGQLDESKQRGEVIRPEQQVTLEVNICIVIVIVIVIVAGWPCGQNASNTHN